MKTLPAGLTALLQTGVTTLCTCWLIERRDGAVFGFTNHDRMLTFGGVDFEPASGFTASETEAALGLQVDTMEVHGALSSDAITEADIALGLWDDATFETWRVDWQHVANRAILQKGSTGEVARGDIAFMAELRGLSHQLNQETGRTYQRPCDARLGDARCSVDLDDPDYSGTGTVAASLDDRLLTVTGLDAFEEDFFSFGQLTWTGGANAGGAVEVAGHLIGWDGSVTVRLWRRAALPVAPGDTFGIVAGCSKSFAMCGAKFDNAINFRGFPHMPGNDFALSTAKREGVNDGSSFFA